MASKAIEFHAEASLEFEAAFEWYLERSESVASRFAAEIDRAIQAIADAPQRWPSGPNETRRFLLARFPFFVVYRELPSTIQVLAVAHGRRRPGYWQERI